ncbi:hypothetical protein IC582_023524 [Cucumis melo]
MDDTYLTFNFGCYTSSTASQPLLLSTSYSSHPSDPSNPPLHHNPQTSSSPFFPLQNLKLPLPRILPPLRCPSISVASHRSASPRSSRLRRRFSPCTLRSGKYLPPNSTTDCFYSPRPQPSNPCSNCSSLKKISTPKMTMTFHKIENSKMPLAIALPIL